MANRGQLMNWRKRAYCQDAEGREGDSPTSLSIIKRLPILASEYYEKEFPLIGWSPKLRTLLVGTRDEESSGLHQLRGFEDTIIRHIYSFFSSEYMEHVKLTLPAKNTGKLYGNRLCRFYSRGQQRRYDIAEDLKSDFVSFASCAEINFPPPTGRNVNMMPFILGKKETLPEDLRCYYKCIKDCPIGREQYGKVCYLTIHESYVDASRAQRREGLHIETPGMILSQKGSGTFIPGQENHWGGDKYEGGIYFASSVGGTSMVYDALVNKNIPGIVDRHGGCEHLRNYLGPGTKLRAGQVVWMTDRTPHEALPQEESGYRQFFRVVTSHVSHWFAQHSTPNPLVPIPDNVLIVNENKFD